MPVIRFLRNLLAVPLVVAATALAMLSADWASRLYHWAWLVSLEPRQAFRAAQQALKAAGPQAALFELETALARTPCSMLWAYAGLVHMDLDDPAGAATCLREAHDLGPDPDGLSELLAMRLAYLDPQDNAEAGRLAESLEARRDVSGLVTRIALHIRVIALIGQGRFEEAAQRVDRLLGVTHDPFAEIAGWAIDRHAGRHEQARQRLARCASVPPGDLVHLQCTVAAIGGLDDEVDRLRDELVERCTPEQVRQIEDIQRRREERP